MKIARRQSKCEVPSMAMGDIAFNLLVFFVILAKAQDDSHLQWQPAHTAKIEIVGHPKASVVIDRENKLYLNGNETAVSALGGALSAILGNTPAGERTVLLKVHKDTLAQRFEPVIEAISEAGGDLVHVLEEKKPEARQP